ncbi:MAG: hypothetical protein ACFFAZ_14115, partial [Promethearchaeota archaeon]
NNNIKRSRVIERVTQSTVRKGNPFTRNQKEEDFGMVIIMRLFVTRTVFEPWTVTQISLAYS